MMLPMRKNSCLARQGGADQCVGRWVGLVMRGVIMLLLTCGVPEETFAQTATGGWAIQIYGTVQVEPGPNVVKMDVKGEEIRFNLQNTRSSDKGFAVARFASDVTHFEPGLHMRGPEAWLDLLLKERPGKRVLKIDGYYYPDSRNFVITNLQQFREAGKEGP